jgi:hypothetical protein
MGERVVRRGVGERLPGKVTWGRVVRFTTLVQDNTVRPVPAKINCAAPFPAHRMARSRFLT